MHLQRSLSRDPHVLSVWTLDTSWRIRQNMGSGSTAVFGIFSPVGRERKREFHGPHANQRSTRLKFWTVAPVTNFKTYASALDNAST